MRQEEHYHLCPHCGTLTPYLQTRCDCGYTFRTRPPVNRRAVIALSVACACLLLICCGLYTDMKQAEDAAHSKASAMYSDGYNEGYGVGYREGESSGIEKGYESALHDNFDEGYDAGYKDGYAYGSTGLDWSGGRFTEGLTNWNAAPPALSQSARWWEGFFSSAEFINPYTQQRIRSMSDFEEYAQSYMADYAARFNVLPSHLLTTSVRASYRCPGA